MCLSSFGLNGVIFGCVRDNTGFDSCSNSKFNSVEQGITLVSFWLFYESAEYDWLKWTFIGSWEDKSIGLFKRSHFFQSFVDSLFGILSNDLIWDLGQGGCGTKERKEDLMLEAETLMIYKYFNHSQASQFNMSSLGIIMSLLLFFFVNGVFNKVLMPFICK